MISHIGITNKKKKTTTTYRYVNFYMNSKFVLNCLSYNDNVILYY